ncbi:DODA-type extradiol aromatic ring-opening family dioxygenase [Azospirillum sp. ST 5-10]|uniref:DODA-type extradiol aromatic ring-opening family dioxygenase n=1 Tax=unclassified Azospirillum TaxID=2630922 RepID=UPI003F4A3918
MARVVTAISMSHAPGAVGWADSPPADQRQRLAQIHESLRQRLADARPDVIVAFLDDHFENHFRTLMPTLSIGVAPSHSGPADYMMEALKFDEKVVLPGCPELAEEMLRKLVHTGFDVARMGEIEYGNNLLVPLKFIRPEFDIPVIPLFINVFSPPLMPYDRAYAFGAAVRRIVDEMPDDLRVAFLATGGLSHWPPVWTEGAPEDDAFLQRMKRYQSEGKAVLAEDPGLYSDLAGYEIDMMNRKQWPLGFQHPLVNEHWDREMLDGFAKGDVAYMRALTYEEVEERGGHGGHEVLNWVALMGAMNGAPAAMVAYESVVEWITGMSYVAYDAAA